MDQVPKYFNPTDIIILKDFTLVVTSYDITNSKGQFKLFHTPNEANNWIHFISKEQIPWWHNKNNCQHPECSEIDGTKYDDWREAIGI